MTYFLPKLNLARFAVCIVAVSGCGTNPLAKSPDNNGIYHVYPGEEIQAVLDIAATDPLHKHVKVHAGTYRPAKHAQAMVYFNARHDGILLEADGDVILTAANPAISDRSATTYPAIVNHVVYFGDGITRNTAEGPLGL